MSVLLVGDAVAPSALLDYGPLTSFMVDPAVTEIMVNGHREIWIERAGQLLRTDARFATEEALWALIGRIAANVGRRISPEEPMLDARLPDGSRVNAIVPPLSLCGPVLTVRRFGAETMSADDLLRAGSITPAALDFLAGCVISRRNVLISGRTGSGKTTLLNVLSTFIPVGERIITIEDTAELQLHQPHWIRLESRPPDLDGAHQITARDLVRNSLRMRPDRIVVGECRGGEALDMLQAMSTGHEGSMSTIHANSARDALQRLETLSMMSGIDVPHSAVRDQIGNAIHVLVHVDREYDGHRQVIEISEIVGREGEVVTMQDLFTLDTHAARPGDRLRPTRIRPIAIDAMVPVRHQLPPGVARLYPDPRLAAA
ncbi:MAG TPA: CpaF family protein [Candidatus Dormibacteraeota bacterium]|jgi:pilus assembly protein CpaF|nr:CpaF family protein [Candidatus Dormibacteraeota bacterium]